MKKLLMFLLIISMVGAFALTGCGSSEPAAAEDEGQEKSTGYADGIYFAQEDEFAGSGYKYFVVLTVEGGSITDAYWGGTNIVPQGNKRTASEQGNYPMVAAGGAAADWHVQAEAAETWLIENQDPAAFEEFYTDEEGHTDALKTDDGTQVSIHVIEFFSLAEKALASDPVPAGEYDTPEDYVATAELPIGDKGWSYKGEFIVVNGTIVDALFNAAFEGEFNEETAGYFKTDADGNPDPESPSSKLELKEAYGMPWHVQANAAADYVVENQGFAVNYIDDEGHTDSISGVSIHVIEFEELFNKALGLE